MQYSYSLWSLMTGSKENRSKGYISGTNKSERYYIVANIPLDNRTAKIRVISLSYLVDFIELVQFSALMIFLHFLQFPCRKLHWLKLKPD